MSLFQHQESPEAFAPKKDTGVLANYCINCNQRIEAHQSVWRTAQGSLRACPPAEEREERIQPPPVVLPDPEPLQPIRTPFGTQHNIDPYNRKGGRGHLVGSTGGAWNDHLHGAACESTAVDEPSKPVPHQIYTKSHLQGAGVQNINTQAPRTPVPCQRTNVSHLKGAAIQTVYPGEVQQNLAHH